MSLENKFIQPNDLNKYIDDISIVMILSKLTIKR